MSANCQSNQHICPDKLMEGNGPTTDNSIDNTKYPHPWSFLPDHEELLEEILNPAVAPCKQKPTSDENKIPDDSNFNGHNQPVVQSETELIPIEIPRLCRRVQATASHQSNEDVEAMFADIQDTLDIEYMIDSEIQAKLKEWNELPDDSSICVLTWDRCDWLKARLGYWPCKQIEDEYKQLDFRMVEICPYTSQIKELEAEIIGGRHIHRPYVGADVSFSREFKLPIVKHIPKSELLTLMKEEINTGAQMADLIAAWDPAAEKTDRATKATLNTGVVITPIAGPSSTYCLLTGVTETREVHASETAIVDMGMYIDGKKDLDHEPLSEHILRHSKMTQFPKGKKRAHSGSSEHDRRMKRQKGMNSFPPPEAPVIRKRLVKQYDVVLPAHEFIVAKKFIAVWVRFNPAKTYFEETVWETDPLFHMYLRPLLNRCGWTDDEFVVPKGEELCPYRGPDGRQCTAENRGHHSRHMLSHSPNGIGYFAICPACKTAARRTDMFSRHITSCEVYSSRKMPPRFQDAYEQNIFLRLPWSQELEDLSQEQKKKRAEGEIQFWLPGDEWVETAIRVPPTDKGRTKPPTNRNSDKSQKVTWEEWKPPEASASQQSVRRVKKSNRQIN